MNVGPTRHGSPDNPILCIICDPGSKAFEGSKAIGMLYTTISRATQLSQNGDITSSAIYFNGQDMVFGRVANLFHGKDGKPFKKVTARAKWVTFLDSNLGGSQFTAERKNQITSWVHSDPLCPNRLEEIVHNMSRR